LHFDPFGEVAQTVAELSDSRDLSRGALRGLTAIILDAERSFVNGRGQPGCRMLNPFDLVLEGKKRRVRVRPPTSASTGM
jgi:hypothetical protein